MKPAPIGVFDSGVGGLSILRALRAELPHESFVYLADSGHAPYGERDDTHLIARARAITRHLIDAYAIKALVMACNTATATTIHVLRSEQPGLPIVGVEPALKPALSCSRTGRIGVMATRRTLGSAKFHALLDALRDQADFVCQPCDGLADAIEHDDTSKIIALCARYTGVMGTFGTQAGQMDTLVLGCTHYPFAAHHLRALLGPDIHLLDNGEPVARQTRRVLPFLAAADAPTDITLLTTGDGNVLQQAARHWLGLNEAVRPTIGV